MRHRVAKNKLNRTSSHRKAMFKNMTASLFTHGRIITTVTKAKAVRPFAEKLITLAKKKGLAAYRLTISRLGDETAAKKLFDEIVPLYEDRNGGYTRILKLGETRLGDNAERAIIELVGYDVDEKKVTGETPEKAAAPAGKKPARKKTQSKAAKTETVEEKAQDVAVAEAETEPEEAGKSEENASPEEENQIEEGADKGTASE